MGSLVMCRRPEEDETDQWMWACVCVCVCFFFFLHLTLDFVTVKYSSVVYVAKEALGY